MDGTNSGTSSRSSLDRTSESRSSTETLRQAPPDSSSVNTPEIHEKRSARASFFGNFRSDKMIERDHRHAVLKARIETYAKLEIELQTLNAALVEIIKKLDVGTGAGTKTFLLAAADNCIAALTQFNQRAGALLQAPTPSSLTDDQINNFYQNYKAVRESLSRLDSVYKATATISRDVMERIKTIQIPKKKFEDNLQRLYRSNTPTTTLKSRYEAEQRAASVNATPPSGSESDSEEDS